jgi:hypothetical protein
MVKLQAGRGQVYIPEAELFVKVSTAARCTSTQRFSMAHTRSPSDLMIPSKFTSRPGLWSSSTARSRPVQIGIHSLEDQHFRSPAAVRDVSEHSPGSSPRESGSRLQQASIGAIVCRITTSFSFALRALRDLDFFEPLFPIREMKFFLFSYRAEFYLLLETDRAGLQSCSSSVSACRASCSHIWQIPS